VTASRAIRAMRTSSWSSTPARVTSAARDMPRDYHPVVYPARRRTQIQRSSRLRVDRHDPLGASARVPDQAANGYGKTLEHSANIARAGGVRFTLATSARNERPTTRHGHLTGQAPLGRGRRGFSRHHRSSSARLAAPEDYRFATKPAVQSLLFGLSADRRGGWRSQAPLSG